LAERRRGLSGRIRTEVLQLFLKAADLLTAEDAVNGVHDDHAQSEKDNQAGVHGDLLFRDAFHAALRNSDLAREGKGESCGARGGGFRSISQGNSQGHRFSSRLLTCHRAVAKS
jgi:hypothetical protein